MSRQFDKTIKLDSKTKCEYLTKYKYNTLVGGAPDNVEVDIARGCDPAVTISGPEVQMAATERFVRDIVQGVKTTRFVLNMDSNSEVLARAVDAVSKTCHCIVQVETLPSRDPATGAAIDVSVVLTELQLQKADVIVNTIHCNLTLIGQLASALKRACGDDLQSELRRKYPNGIENGHFAVTSPCRLHTCKKIYHGALPRWKGLQSVSMEECFKTLVRLLYRCLVTATEDGYKSIAFPALGTGELKYPVDSVATLMFRTISWFLKHNPNTSLEQIYVVVYPKMSLDVKQWFLSGEATLGLASVQVDSAAKLHEALRASTSETFEMLFRVGKTLVKVMNADYKEACSRCCPALVLWTPGEMQNPNSNMTVKYMDPEVNTSQVELVVGYLEQCLAESDSNSLPGRTLLHSYCAGLGDKEVKMGIQRGLEQTKKNDCPFLSIPVAPGGILWGNPSSTAKILFSAVNKCSSCVPVVIVLLPDIHVFMPFVMKAITLYKPLEVSSWDFTHLIETNLKEKAATCPSPIQSDRCVFTVTSDSEVTNTSAEMEIRRQILESTLETDI